MSERRFRLGVNYWPASSALLWWSSFDAREVAADFERIAASGCDAVRLFLTWEAFQPALSVIDPRMVERLVQTLEIAKTHALSVMPTLFTGHMSGVNLIPGWALGGQQGDGRFRVLAGGQVTARRPLNWYTDPDVVGAQVLLARSLAGSLCGHEALWAWDLGNENSNCVVPPNRTAGLDWLGRISDAIRATDHPQLITMGLHMEDLEQDRNLGPAEAASVCDFLTMHGYPGYASWAHGPTDDQLLPFLARVTGWLAGGKEVLFSEFGVPTSRTTEPRAARAPESGAPVLVTEEEAARYVGRALSALQEAGCLGAMIWCHSDYARSLWSRPPLDCAIHERSFGLWRADGAPKPAVAAVAEFASNQPTVRRDGELELMDRAWIDVEPGEFQADPGVHLPRLYSRYRDARGSASENV